MPVLSIWDTFTSYAVAEAINRKGWLSIGRMRKPKCFLVIVMHHHEGIVDESLRSDLQTAVRQAERAEVTAPDKPNHV